MLSSDVKHNVRALWLDGLFANLQYRMSQSEAQTRF